MAKFMTAIKRYRSQEMISACSEAAKATWGQKELLDLELDHPKPKYRAERTRIRVIIHNSCLDIQNMRRSITFLHEMYMAFATYTSSGSRKKCSKDRLFEMINHPRKLWVTFCPGRSVFLRHLSLPSDESFHLWALFKLMFHSDFFCWR